MTFPTLPQVIEDDVIFRLTGDNASRAAIYSARQKLDHVLEAIRAAVRDSPNCEMCGHFHPTSEHVLPMKRKDPDVSVHEQMLADRCAPPVPAVSDMTPGEFADMLEDRDAGKYYQDDGIVCSADQGCNCGIEDASAKLGAVKALADESNDHGISPSDIYELLERDAAPALNDDDRRDMLRDSLRAGWRLLYREAPFPEEMGGRAFDPPTYGVLADRRSMTPGSELPLPDEIAARWEGCSREEAIRQAEATHAMIRRLYETIDALHEQIAALHHGNDDEDAPDCDLGGCDCATAPEEDAADAKESGPTAPDPKEYVDNTDHKLRLLFDTIDAQQPFGTELANFRRRLLLILGMP